MICGYFFTRYVLSNNCSREIILAFWIMRSMFDVIWDMSPHIRMEPNSILDVCCTRAKWSIKPNQRVWARQSSCTVCKSTAYLPKTCDMVCNIRISNPWLLFPFQPTGSSENYERTLLHYGMPKLLNFALSVIFYHDSSLLLDSWCVNLLAYKTFLAADW